MDPVLLGLIVWSLLLLGFALLAFLLVYRVERAAIRGGFDRLDASLQALRAGAAVKGGDDASHVRESSTGGARYPAAVPARPLTHRAM